MSSDSVDSRAPISDEEPTHRSLRPQAAGQPTPESPGSPPDQQKTVVAKLFPDGSPTPLKPLASRELGELLEGWELGHYRLEEFVGGGGMGAVFRATDMQLQRSVAVKVISGRHTDPEAVKRFKVEAQSAARLDHLNIARVYYVGQDKGWHYIVFEYIDGVNLRELVAHKGPLPQGEAVGYVLQVAAALDHAASRDVVHRDIKPSNVLVLADGSVKVVDMGLARLHQMESAHDLTESGVTLGSFDYISPEQAKDPRNADVRSDLYSLGCTMYHMLTGQPPFPSGTALQKLLRHSSDRPLDPRKLRPDLDGELVGVMLKLLAKQPSARYQNPRDLIGALMRVAPRLGLRTDGAGVAYVTAGPKGFERHLPWALPTAALLLLVAVMATLDRGPDIPFQPPPAPPLAMVAPDATATFATARGVNSNDADDLPDSPPGEPAEFPADRADPGSIVGGRSPSVETPLHGTSSPSRSEPPAGQSNQTVGSSSDSPSTPAKTALSPNAPEAPTFIPESPRGSPTARNSEAKSVSKSDSNSERRTPSPGLNGAQPADASLGTMPTAPLTTVDDEASGVTMIVVGLAPPLSRPDARYVESVEDAFRALENYPQVAVIELAVDGLLPVRPIHRLLPHAGALNVRAAAGYTPILVFEPQFPAWGDGRYMLTVGRGKVVLDQLHIVFRVPDAPTERFAMFRLQRDGELELNNCSVTIENSDALDRSVQEAAFVEVSDGAGVGMMTGSAESHPPLALRVTRCILRGDADVIRCPQAVTLTAVFRQSLLITSRRALTAGISTMQEDWQTSLRLDMQHCTLIARRGLAQWSVSGPSASSAELLFTVAHCIIGTAADAPLLEHVGPFSQERLLGQGLRFRDEENVYPSTQIRLRTSGDGMAAPQDLLFSRRNEPWHDGIGVSAFLKWRKPPSTDVPIHLHRARDYVVQEHGGGEEAPGVNLALLPATPDALPRPGGPSSRP